ncbi:pentatricopeptide repeat-containing protein At2g03380, mitochondrial-like [Hibiscus syriacus]|uniref:pentatricopeptide repeat-containing protein At2g03380, mitochondrial-like n=1 Tax=Hibiscus syriacus TaxID=106335 RepID=UPI001924F501|nr:pentatricopeptide repeat-containing protein At2g03380, mitochondrial-like [Hibiscus syriacus]
MLPSITRESIKIHKQILPSPTGTSPVIGRLISTLSTKPNPHESTAQHNNVSSWPHSFSHQTLLHSSLFSQLRSPSNLYEAKRLHATLIVNGFFNSSDAIKVPGSQLVNVYVRFGCLEDALFLFDKLPQRSNLAWNAILRGFLDAGGFSRAIEFYHLMVSQGLVPDNFTYPLVFKACIELNDIEEGKKLRDFIVWNESQYNMKRNVYVECAMIDMFAKCGSLSEARQVFEGIGEKDLACWSALICGNVQSGEWLEALSLFKRMLLEGLRPDSVIMVAVLPSCGRLEDMEMGMTHHGCAIKCGFESDLYVSNALMDMYCKCSATRFAYSLFCNMDNKDVVSWSTLIAGYSQNCQYNESLQLYIMMKDTQIRTNAVIASSVLPVLSRLKLSKLGKEMHGYILKQGFDSDIVVGASLVEFYSSCNSMIKAEHVFRMMSESDIMLWNSIIVGYSLNGGVENVFHIFRRIWDFHLRPNSITLISILPICTKIGTLRYGKEIHAYATRSDIGSAVSVGNALIDMYCKCGSLELAVRVFNQMKERNIVTYNTIISAHGIYGLGEHIFQFFEKMKEARIRPNKVTFITLLTACSHSGLVDRGWSLYHSMVYDYNIPPDMEHYSCIVDLLGRAGHLDDAYYLIKRMPVEPDMNVLGSLLGACRVHNKVDLAECIMKHILEKNQKDSGHYVLLSNVYASTGRWKDAMKVRTMIKEKHLPKRPGSSWIEISQTTGK